MASKVPYTIRIRVMLFVALSICIILSSGYWLTRQYINAEMQEISHYQLSMMGESMRTTIVEMMKSGADDKVLDQSYQHIIDKQPEVLDLRVLHSEALSRQFGIHQHELPKTELEKKALTSAVPLIDQRTENGREITEFVYPLFAEQKCLSCHDARLGESLGAMSLLLDRSGIQRLIEEEKSELIRLSLIEIAVLLLLLLWALNHFIFKPLTLLGEGANRFAAGDMSRKVEGESSSELGLVVTAFNNMADQIQLLLGDQEHVIQEQAIELTHLMETSQYISSEQPLSDTLAQFSKTLVDVLKVTTCRMLMLNDDGNLDVTVEHPIRPITEVASPTGNSSNCPYLWKAISLNDYLLVRHDDPVTDIERQLLRLDMSEAALCVPISNKGKVFGVIILSEFRAFDRDPIDQRKIQLCRAMVSQMGAAIEIAKLYERLVEQLMETVLAMAESVEKKSPWTAGHSRRVTNYALTLARGLGWSDDKLEELRIAGLLHDIGKIAVPGSILNKPGRLNEDEYAIIKRHPEDGAQILSKIRMLRPHIPMIRHHHEWYNGDGYPDGLRGIEIPLGARILAVADAYDAMTADRPYRKGLSHEQAIERLEKAVGSQFDGDLVEVIKQALQAKT